MDEETARFVEIRKIKLARLYELDKQAAAFGEYSVPPHVEMERGSLREELGMMEAAINSPARAEVGDELGAAGRFLVYHQQNREIKQSIAALAVDLHQSIAQSLEWRAMQRNWNIVIAIVVILIFAIVVALVTALFVGGMPR